MNEGISLYDLQKRIKTSIDSSFTHQYWVKGEISALKTNYSGHCYIDLVDNDAAGGGIRAKASAIIWSSAWRIIKPYFESTTGYSLSEGMNILVKVMVQYSELYGLSLIISEIDPSFSVGEMEIRRQKIIQQLRSEGMFDINKELTLNSLPRRFAVISSLTAAGYRDFMEHLHKNEYGFSFYTKLFPAMMQGSGAPKSIVQALDDVLALLESGEEEYDAVLILRGGGSSIDLSCFDDYDMCVAIAQFPLPVFTAIGHDQDYHICDMVSFRNLKTPTALADYFVDVFVDEDSQITSIATRLALAVSNKLSMEENRLRLFEQRITKGNPLSLIESGYSIIQKNGMKIDSIDSIAVGDTVKIMVKGGSAECRVEKIEKMKK